MDEPLERRITINHSYKSHKLRDKKRYIVAFFCSRTKVKVLGTIEIFCEILENLVCSPLTKVLIYKNKITFSQKQEFVALK